jgi:RNA polymerase sigma-70 factor (ECF subfamily)
MSGDAESSTSVTLLVRLRNPADARAWGEFVDRYGPKIHSWCGRWRLQEADAENVTQEVLLKLVKKLRTFRYDPDQSFRGWLHTVTHNVLYDLREAQKRPGEGSGDKDVEGLLVNVEAREDLVQRLEEEFDREVLELAAQEVRLLVKPATWRAFSLVAFEGLSTKEAAQQLQMKVGTVIVYHGRVKRMLAEAIARLERPGREGKNGAL